MFANPTVQKRSGPKSLKCSERKADNWSWCWDFFCYCLTHNDGPNQLRSHWKTVPSTVCLLVWTLSRKKTIFTVFTVCMEEWTSCGSKCGRDLCPQEDTDAFIFLVPFLFLAGPRCFYFRTSPGVRNLIKKVSSQVSGILKSNTRRQNERKKQQQQQKKHWCDRKIAQFDSQQAKLPSQLPNI